jgi:hypothetical protein
LAEPQTVNKDVTQGYRLPIKERVVVSHSPVTSYFIHLHTVMALILSAVLSDDSNSSDDNHAAGTDTPATSNPEEATPAEEPGSRIEYKHVDEIYDPKTGIWTFRDSAPYVVKTDDAYAPYAFTINRKFDYQGLNPEVTIDIKSAALATAGAAVVGNIGGISWHAPLRVSFFVFCHSLSAHLALSKGGSPGSVSIPSGLQDLSCDA